MKSTQLLSLAILLTAFIIAGCQSGPEPLYDISDQSYRLLDTDSTAVNFPRDYNGQMAVISFIFTHCPDVCPIITANMKNIQRELQDTSGVQFIEISFDPARDTPSVLKDYKNLYQLNDQFTMLTGDTTTVNSLLEKLEIIAVKTEPDSSAKNTGDYNMRHSNTIYLMDTYGQIRAEYPASRVPPEHVVEDINYLRRQ
jgi:protein SCO1/2